MGKLPSHFQPYFNQERNITTNSAIRQKWLWLIGIRKGRQRYDQDHLVQDEFMQAGAFKTWLGL